MRTSSQKEVIARFEQGFKLEEANQHRRTVYYLTNYKDLEITVAKGTIEKMKEKGVIDSNNDYKRNVL